MDAYQNMFFSGTKVPTAALFQFTPLKTHEKEHLGRVFGYLALSVLTTVAGVKFSHHFFALPVFLAFILQLGCVFYLKATSNPYHNPRKDTSYFKRVGAFCALSFFCGVSMSPFLRYAYYLHPSLIPTSFCATLAVFFCFSLAAMFANQRKFLFLGGLLSSILGYLSMVALFNIFFNSSIAHDAVLYGGLLVYMGFVLYDTQVILFRLNHGDQDAIMHAVTFYSDIIGIFVKLTRILMEREQRHQSKEKRDARY